ncbi:MAG: tetratricopeptide repeat protein [Thermodesulfovibrionales bacterium]|jgi:tetratricopeptide (TPR) repeat protein
MVDFGAIFILLLLLLAQYPLRVSAAEKLSSSDKRASVSIVVRDREGREVARDSGVVVDRGGVVVTVSALISRWLENVDYLLSAETASGESLPVENVLSVSKRFGLAVIAVKGSELFEGKIAGEDRMEYIRGQISRYKKIKKKEAQEEKDLPLPPRKEEAEKKAEVPKLAPPSGQAQQETRPDDPELHFLLAKAHHKAGGYADALDEYREVLKLRPDHVEALINIGMLYAGMGRYAEAVDAYRRAVGLRPDEVEVYNKLATVHMIREEYREAIEVFTRAVEIDPANLNARYGLGMAFFMTGDKNAALEQYIILNRLDRKKADELFNLVFQ